MQKAMIARAGECSLAACLSLLAACSGRTYTDEGFVYDPKATATCPPPPPGPAPIAAWLNYPPSGSTNVPTNIGEIIEQGAAPGNGLTIVVSSSAGELPLGTPTTAPSPYPSPFATAPPQNAYYPHIAIPLPTLSPSTSYTVTDVYTDWADNPPQCSAQYSQPVGSFTTGQ